MIGEFINQLHLKLLPTQISIALFYDIISKITKREKERQKERKREEKEKRRSGRYSMLVIKRKSTGKNQPGPGRRKFSSTSSQFLQSLVNYLDSRSLIQ